MDYSTKDLGEGTIGGRGFWLCKEARRLTAFWRDLANSNLNLERPLDEALIYNKKLPFILNQSVLEFAWDSWNNFQFWSWVPSEPAFQTVASFGGKNLKAWANWMGSVGTGGASYRCLSQRHAHRTLFDNKQGGFAEAVNRIQIGNSGYTDTLPGLFEIRPVAGSIVSGDHCDVTILPYSNPRVWWQYGDSRIHWDWEADFGSVYHPYIRRAAQAVRVDLTAGNHNKHVIPGVDMQLNTPLEGDRFVIAIGYEHVNMRSDVDGIIGEINGIKECFQPMTARNVQPEYNANSGNYYGVPLFLGRDSAASVVPSRWHIYNVTGQAQEGCEFHIHPLVRLDQGNNLHPFDQWFMGQNVVTALTPQSATRQITFVNYVAGIPATVKMVFSDLAIDMMVREINPATYEPTGMNHADASGLKCDGTTLYRWDAVGIYFVLSPSLVLSDTALVHCRKGASIERFINNISGGGTPTYTETPASKIVGAWDAFYDAGVDKHYPGSFAIPYAQRTGIIQTQGHDFEFFDADIDPLNQHWYNHQFCIETWNKFEAQTEYDNLNEYVCMVTCNDKRYFQVIPHTWLYANEAGSIYDIESLTPSAARAHMSANISRPDTEYSMHCSGNVHMSKRGLVLRVNKLSPQLIALMADSGIILEG